MLTTVVIEKPGEAVVILPERLHLAPEEILTIWGELRDCAAAGNKTITVDMSRVGSIDSMLLGRLLEVKKELVAAGGTIILRSPSKAVHDVLVATKLTGELKVEPT